MSLNENNDRAMLACHGDDPCMHAWPGFYLVITSLY